MNKLIQSIASVVLGATVVLPGVHADDTEIFFSRSAANAGVPASVLFMFDTSGSMDAYDGTGLQRIDRLKRAMIDVINAGTNARIGIGAFNGRNRGGSILIPPVALDEDRCSGTACTSIPLRIPINAAGDDGHEAANGSLELGFDSMVMSEYVPSWLRTTKYIYLGAGTDDAMEYASGTLDVSSSRLEMFGTSNSNVPTIGLRFPGVGLPPGARVLYADLGLVVPSSSNTSGEQHARIRIDSAEDSPTFGSGTGQTVLGRSYLAEAVEWQDINNSSEEDRKVYSGDISTLVQARIDRADWEDGDAMTFQLEISGDNHTSTGNRREFKAFEAGMTTGAETRLKIEYVVAPITPQTVGMRFNSVKIPKGSTIQRAWLELIASKSSSRDANLDIRAQASGNAPAFSSANNDLTSRATTAASSTWTPQPWVQAGRRESTGDFTNVVQEIVNRSDWCGGNSMALIITGSGVRDAVTYDSSPWNAPVLRVEYAPSSVDFNNTCLSTTESTRVAGTIDDVSEALDSGAVNTSSTELLTRQGTVNNAIGLRFRNVQIPQGATVVDARLRLVSAGTGSGSTDATVTGELATDSAAFSSLRSNDVSARTSTGNSVNWLAMEDMNQGNGLQSPNLAPVVGEIVAQAGWAPGNSLALRLQGSVASTGYRRFKSFDSEGAPSLLITYQLSGAELGGTPIALRTGRDDLVDTMLGFRASGGTPLLDAYYEAAAYMTGTAVEFGKVRGDQNILDRYYRVSASDTYSGGSYFRPPLCSESDLDNVACIGERIDSNPVYDAPPGSICQANQIVLLTDGEATKNASRGLIESMTGVSSCAARSNDREDCGLELGSWLKATDHSASIEGIQSIITNTVGFAFSSSFLSELAAASGGSFFTASTSAELANVFSNIIRKTAQGGTSFVAPASSVSQTNRLTNSNDLYFGQFAPKSSTKWGGNLKKYRLAASLTDASQTVVAGADGQPVLDDNTGTFLDSAKSFWSTSADGADVEQGGAASRLTLTRNLFTYTSEPSAAGTPLVALSETTNAITDSLLDIEGSPASTRTELLQWARGVDIKDTDNDGNTSEVRAQMGDPLHSLPAILNYTNQSLVFVGTNEGYLHAIDTSDGKEVFGFVPKTLLRNLKHFFADEPGTDRVYGLDGPITAWFDDTNQNRVVDGAEKAYVVVGMRRGGRDYYALDVTNPAIPKIQWIISGGSGDFAELGQTWSKPVKTRLNVAGTPRDVLLFAAGYDKANDDKVSRDLNDTQGRGVYIVDALSGERLGYKTHTDLTDMDYAIPSTLRVIDIDVDTLADTFFVGDMGGQVWRFDIDNTATGSLNTAITGGVIADLGGAYENSNRRFYYEPDVALVSDDTSGQFLTIAIGSGYRAHPLDSTVEDRFFVLRDRAVFGPPKNASDVVAYTRQTESSLFDATTASGSSASSSQIANGWFMDFPGVGEKMLSQAVTINNQLVFTTYLPNAGTVGPCGLSVGGGRVYAVDARNGDAISDLNGSNALTSSNRYRKLNLPGIPPGVSALIPQANAKSPVLLVGPEVLPALDFGDLFRHTFWTAD